MILLFLQIVYNVFFINQFFKISLKFKISFSILVVKLNIKLKVGNNFLDFISQCKIVILYFQIILLLNYIINIPYCKIDLLILLTLLLKLLSVIFSLFCKIYQKTHNLLMFSRIKKKKNKNTSSCFFFFKHVKHSTFSRENLIQSDNYIKHNVLRADFDINVIRKVFFLWKLSGSSKI